MTVRIYRSTDTGAPTLTGQAGSLTTLLDAILVNGYNSNNPAGAGWTIAYTATSKRGYRMSATDGTGFYLNVDDTGGGAGGAREAFMTGFEVMSAISVGTGQFPTAGQLNLGSAPAGAVVCRKSTTADATARAWTCIADDTVFYLFVETADLTSPIMGYPFAFGDFFSYKSSDAYRCMIIGRNIVNNATGASDGFSALLSGTGNYLATTMLGHYLARSWTAVGGSVPFGKHIDHGKVGGMGPYASLTGASALPNVGGMAIGYNPGQFSYPNGPDGGLYLSPIWLHHSGSVRGYFKGLWAPCHDRPLNHNDTYSGTGNMSGKSFVAQSIVAWIQNVNQAGQVHIESSDTWS